MKFETTTYLPIHNTEKQLMNTLLADKDNFTSQMMLQVLQNDQAQRFMQLIEIQPDAVLVYPFSMQMLVRTWYKLQDPMCEELEMIPNDVKFSDCSWLETGCEDCPTWYDKLGQYRRDVIRDAYHYISTQ